MSDRAARGAGALHDDDVLDRRGVGQGDVDGGLEQAAACPRRQPPSAVMSDLALGVVDAVGQRVGREPAEHHRVGGADAGAGQQGRPAARGSSACRWRPGRPSGRRGPSARWRTLHLGEQVGVGDGAGVARLALPVERDLVAAAGLDVAVEAVVRDVELAADEPLGEGQVPLEDRVPVRRPSRAARRPGGPRTPRSPGRPRRRGRSRLTSDCSLKSSGGGKVRSSSR